ncbi:universal stress protein [Nocardioides albus]|uniref:Nucleotide-binding universal stress UspA family protein n=1 Tax=Nocardioides albus TaxID=1841 RepID=A0A7W5A5J3_9ACTN|nr:universal stress protein [Nocardioides albus]MBB3089883.1 nucleotide-binding universal stress UspA family protein [Nocardioides albus]GGU36323.1 universal stress protein [Nocardioides albus]
MTYAAIPEGAVVVGIENWPAAADSVSWAAEQAFRDGRDVCLLHVVPRTTLEAGSPGEPAQAHGRIVLASARRFTARRLDELSRIPAFYGHRRPEVSVALQVGAVAPVLDLAAEHASLLVLGSRGRGPIGSWVLGSVSRSTLRDARCPVVVLCPGAGGVGQGVLVGIDGTADSIPALEFAFERAATGHLPVTVLYCYGAGGPDRPARDQVRVAACISGLRERHPDLRPCLRIQAGSLAHALTEQAQAMHMVVVGSRGDVGGYLLNHAHSIVAVVPTCRQDRGGRSSAAAIAFAGRIPENGQVDL